MAIEKLRLQALMPSLGITRSAPASRWIVRGHVPTVDDSQCGRKSRTSHGIWSGFAFSPGFEPVHVDADIRSKDCTLTIPDRQVARGLWEEKGNPCERTQGAGVLRGGWQGRWTSAGPGTRQDAEHMR